MGLLFRLFRVFSSKITVSDNFEYIALNMVLFRYVLEEDYADRFEDEDSLIITCGILDTLIHISEGHFTTKDVKDALLSAKVGQCSLLSSSRSIDTTKQESMQRLLTGRYDKFLDFTLNIEAMCFYAIERYVDPYGMSPEDIILAVLGKKADIKRVLYTPKKKLSRSSLVMSVRHIVSAFMDSPDYAQLRIEAGLE